ncbi:MAG: DUF1028 domain-containing protein [Bacteroidia bacterium]|nr:DUF1028 domain-containing protein [Bacteroidia bacterium]
MKFFTAVLLMILCLATVDYSFAQAPYGKEPLAHTYSIVAMDTATGEMGVAVQSHWFSVGALVSWGEAGVGVIATQSFVNPAFGPQGLALLRTGLTAQQVLDALIQADPGRDVRQLAILDAKGNVATHTGSMCIQPAGHKQGTAYSVQANLMANDKVWPAMAEAYESTQGPLAERLVAALEAAQKAGGDIRGKQSAAILVVRPQSSGQVWNDRLVDLRVEDHATPVKELKRLLKVHRAYEHMNQGDLAVEHGDNEKALEEYGAAEKMFPQNEEMKFWHAVSLINMGKMDEGKAMLKKVFAMNKDWKTLTPRLVPNGLLKVSEKELKGIMKL